jgi:copper transport protein
MNPEVKRLLPVLVAASLVFPAAAAAHANLVRTEPGNGAVLARPPAAVRVVFDDRVRAGPGVEAVRNGGASVLAGKARVAAGGRTLVVPLRPGLPEGDYSVRWSIVSDDGHLESGVLAFAVGTGRAPPLATLSPSATGPTAETVVARFLFFAGLLTAVGVSLFALVARGIDEERLAFVLSTACVLLAVGAADEVHRVGLATRDGRVLGAGVVAAVVVATVAAAATLERRALRPAVLLSLGLAVLPSLAGHALDPGLNRLNVVADVLHVLGASAWIGALVGLVAFRRREERLAVAGVLLLGATGIVRASFELTAGSQLWSTSYGLTLIAKTGLLLVAVAIGLLWRRGRVELTVVALLVIAVAVLVQLRPGRNAPARAAAAAQASEPSRPPPPPPAGAVVLAHELGSLGVALAVEPRRVTVIVLSPAGGGLSGQQVRVAGRIATPCGSGCYRVGVTASGTVVVDVRDMRTAFRIPRFPRPADDLVRRVLRRYHALRSVTYVEHLASDPTHAIDAVWRLEQPNRLAYTISGGPRAVVVGGRRWDSDGPGRPYVPSPQTPLPQPAAQWRYSTDAHVVAETQTTKTVTFVDPTVPAYFTIVVDDATLRPRVLHMTASSHFMTDRYTSFNAGPAIRPPRRRAPPPTGARRSTRSRGGTRASARRS